MAKKRKKIWGIIPSRKKDDQLYNRRLISYFGLIYAAIWFQEILIILIIAIVLKSPLDAAVVAALLGVPTSLAGLGFYKYLQGCNMDDQKRKKDKDNATTPPQSFETESLPPSKRRSDGSHEKEE